MDNDDPFSVRVGAFFMFMGGAAFVIFVASDIAEQVDFDYLFVAVVLIFIGWALRRSKAPAPSAGRFSVIRKWREKRKGNSGGEKKE